MGLYDRDYTQAGGGMGWHSSPQVRTSFGNITPAVKWILIINLVVFFLDSIVTRIWLRTHPGTFGPFTMWFSVSPYSWRLKLQIWRLVTYQFMHAGIFHILFNMIGVYFLGPLLERNWGTKRFVTFYLGCGISGGLLYILLASLGALSVGPMVGASGAVLGLLIACAVLFPSIVVFLFVFPVPIRVAATVLAVIATAVVLQNGFNAGGEAAHLGGMIAGALYVFSQKWRIGLLDQWRLKHQQRQWSAQQDMQKKLDQILAKVHEQGIHSLTSQERQLLKKATEAEQRRKS